MEDLTAKIGISLILMVYLALAVIALVQGEYKITALFVLLIVVMARLFQKEYGVPYK